MRFSVQTRSAGPLRKGLFSLALAVSCTTGSGGDDGNGAGGTSGQGGDAPFGNAGSRTSGAGAEMAPLGGSDGDQGGVSGQAGAGDNPGGTAGAGQGGTVANTGGTGGTVAGTAGTAGSPPKVNCGTLRACDDFEGYSTGSFQFGKFSYEGGGAADYQISTERARSGTKAVKVSTSVGDRTLKLAGIDALTAGGKSVFARVMMFFPELPSVSRSDGPAPHYKLLNMFETAPNARGVNVSAGIVGNNRGRLLYFAPANSKDCAADGAVMAANRWVCVELRADSNGYQAWIDGQSIGAQSAAPGDRCWERHDKVTTVSFGFRIAAATLNKPTTFWMDDFAVDSKRIGCP